MIAKLFGMALMTVGTIFLTIAAIGVLRLHDAFQRMHASTKAGSLGATFTVIGAIFAGGNIEPATAIFTILFLLMTLSISAQLLARAAYVSGATIARLERPDPLEDVIDREDAPLEDRLRRPPPGRTEPIATKPG